MPITPRRSPPSPLPALPYPQATMNLLSVTVDYFAFSGFDRNGIV